MANNVSLPESGDPSDDARHPRPGSEQCTGEMKSGSGDMFPGPLCLNAEGAASLALSHWPAAVLSSICNRRPVTFWSACRLQTGGSRNFRPSARWSAGGAAWKVQRAWDLVADGAMGSVVVLEP